MFTPSRLVLGVAVVGIVGLAYLVPPGPDARADQPKVTAGFQTTEKITLTLDVPASKNARTLTVELIDRKGKVVGSVEPSLPAGPATQTSATFSKITMKPDQLSVRCTHDGKAVESPLDRVLLVRAHETSLTASTELFAGSEAEMVCKVHGVKSMTQTVPLAADVTVSLLDSAKKERELFTGKTGRDGEARIHLQVPEVPSGSYTLQVRTRSALGEETLSRAVKIQTAPKVLLTTDKPLYQPGQTIRLRAIALRAFDLKPATDATVLFEIEDGKGNKVYKKDLKTGQYGIASADFTLADEVNMGEYRLRAQLGEHRAEKTVTVKKYVLPKFKAELTTDKRYYLPKETIRGSLQVDYFFGKPVAGGTVEVKASTFDVAFRAFTTFKGTTDRSGHVKFEIKLPDYFVGHPLASGNAIVKLDAKVTDTADHSEAVARTYPVSDQPIRVSFLPESGRLIPGLENRIFVAALYPDGSPAACGVEVFLGQKAAGKPIATLRTNAAGLAEFKITPKAEQFRTGEWAAQNVELLGGTQQQWRPKNVFDLSAEAKDDRGFKAQATAALTSEPLGENVLLRLDRAVYKGGDRMRLDVHSSAGLPSVYVDVIKAGQTMLTRWLDVKDGKATTALDLPAHVFGTLEVHAYQVLASGEVVRDARVVYVNPASELNVKVIPDRTVYQPGANGTLRFEVSDAKGKPTAAALGVLIVDEAVYAMQEIQPGLEKVFFTLQEELTKPSAQVNYKPGDDVNALVRQDELPAAKQQVAQALLTAVQPKAPSRWQVDPAVQRRQQFEVQVQQIATGLYSLASVQPSIVEQDRKTGKSSFKGDVLAEGIKKGYLTQAMLRDQLGGELTLQTLTDAEKGFTAENLVIGMTKLRMQNLLWGFINLTTSNQAKWHKGGKWSFPDDVLAQAAKSYQGGITGSVDGWGRALKLVRRSEKEKNALGHTQFNDVVMASAGPDGKFGTADDITYQPNDGWTLTATWWQSDRRTPRHPHLAWRWQKQRRLAEFGGGLGAPADGFRFAAMPPGAMGALGGDPRGGGGAMPLAAVTTGAAEMPKNAKADSPNSGPAAEPPAMRLREYFPETLLWRPALITDDRGRATLEVPFADSITTWRLSASASSRGGLLGGVTAPLRVFQDFFVDLDLPVALTQNDEIAFPVAVYNYLKTPQTVTLRLKREPWFDLLDDAGDTRKLTLEQGQVTSVRFRIKAKKVGHFPLTVEARGTKLSDAIKRSIEVLPDGVPVEQVFTDRLQGTVQHKLTIPAVAIDDASKLFVKVYPGVISQVVEGMEGMMRMPCGCFEQTSSSAYPNVLVVDYIKKSRQGSPALLARAEQFLSAGYQRLLTFERPGGGFDWWGSGEPLVWLSAYGLQEFNDMAKVYPVDRGIIERTQAWLMKQQGTDGTWANIGATHGESIERMGDPKLLLTSYVAWAILDSTPRPAGWNRSPEYAKLTKAIAYIRDNAPKAENAYILALAANALAAWDARDDSTHDVLKRLLAKLNRLQQQKADWNAVFFPAKGQSLSCGRDDALVVESTALSILAMLKHGGFTNSVNKALTYLVKTKGSHGHWGSTQATILALKAMIAGLGGSSHKGETPFAILVNRKQVASGAVTEKNADVLQQFDLTSHLTKGDIDVSIQVKGETSLMYQVVGRHFVPHRKGDAPTKPVLEVDVAYDRTKLSTADLLKATATLRYHGKVGTYNVIVDLPIPPGFTVDAGDFAEMVAAKKVQKFSVTGRQVILYLGDVKPGGEHTFAYSLKPKYPIEAKSGSAVAYEYYTPANRATAKPVELVVEAK